LSDPNNYDEFGNFRPPAPAAPAASSSAQQPSPASPFGAMGGFPPMLGAPPSPAAMQNMLSDPMMQQTLQQLSQNPQVCFLFSHILQ
jgi:hypothetical protein